MIKHRSAADVATPAAIKAASGIVQGAKAERSDKEWKEFPTLGMMGEWKIRKTAKGKILCLSTDDAGSHLFTLNSIAGKLFITSVEETEMDCAK
jgi:hypothetical protein